MKKQQNVSERNRTGRLFKTQEEELALLEQHGFSFQKLFREGMEMVIEEKLKLIGLTTQTTK